MDDADDSRHWTDLDVAVRGGRLAAQSLGAATDPALLLLGGATWSRDWWADDFCDRLADLGVRVLRYDPRDTGASTASPPGRPDYTAADLADDAIAVLDAVGVRSATLAGLSMGGGLAQSIAAHHPDRVDALVLLSTSPAGDVERELPPPTAAILATFEEAGADPDWTDRRSVVDWVVRSERPYAGPDAFDEEALREIAGRVWDRSPSMASAANHFLVAEGATPIDLGALRDVPALVVHGSADPLFPPAHGEALAAALGARLIVLDGVGHQAPPPATWAEIVPAIAAHAREHAARP
ncbi:alpha/beta hydrolase [Rathayibacter sp. VKM Ac-2760]|uniref:alpha/beta fold hydrolase n=1 Tax=Rathayibacter sp. VKM Ac-2760 TaxID=2609253 RepID=UPI001315BEF2|nr:alpha/beta hydrolase [Rathayibacter sp. VKM Ac-2760]QHC57502.1 alpha/beta fold hydrolase [Rathayibacter sp. VKM Ac-2760]